MDLNKLEVALQQSDAKLCTYLGNVSISAFRDHIKQMLEKRDKRDCRELKEKNELEAALQQDNLIKGNILLVEYLEGVSLKQLREHIRQIAEKQAEQSVCELKKRLRAALDEA